MDPALIGDIGATNARFALLEDGVPIGVKVLEVAAYPSLAQAIHIFLADLASAGHKRPRLGAVAVAGPITGDAVTLTNHPWSFSIAALTRQIGFDHLYVVNDFVAQAMAVPHLGVLDRRQIGGGDPVQGMPIGIIGPGSGLGVSILVPTYGAPTHTVPAWIPIASEGGHVTLPAVTEREDAIIQWLHRSGKDHVSAETLICGPGLATLYTGLMALDDKPAQALGPAEVSARAQNGSDPIAIEAVGIFCALLGTVAGNLALTAGARGGVYIAGGITPKLGALFDRSEFRARFVAKGRMRSYLEPIPTYLMTEPFPAFIGLAAILSQT